MQSESKSSSWWQTAPGVLTAVGGILTALAALVGALHQAGLFTPATPKPPEVSQPSSSRSSEEAESLAADYLAALFKRDAAKLFSESAVPFLLDREIVFSKDVLRTKYEDGLRKGPEITTTLSIESIRSQRNADWSKGKDDRRISHFEPVHLQDTDFFVDIQVKIEGTSEGRKVEFKDGGRGGFLLVIKNVGGELKVVAFEAAAKTGQ